MATQSLSFQIVKGPQYQSLWNILALCYVILSFVKVFDKQAGEEAKLVKLQSWVEDKALRFRHARVFGPLIRFIWPDTEVHGTMKLRARYDDVVELDDLPALEADVAECLDDLQNLATEKARKEYTDGEIARNMSMSLDNVSKHASKTWKEVQDQLPGAEDLKVKVWSSATALRSRTWSDLCNSSPVDAEGTSAEAVATAASATQDEVDRPGAAEFHARATAQVMRDRAEQALEQMKKKINIMQEVLRHTDTAKLRRERFPLFRKISKTFVGSLGAVLFVLSFSSSFEPMHVFHHKHNFYIASHQFSDPAKSECMTVKSSAESIAKCHDALQAITNNINNPTSRKEWMDSGCANNELTVIEAIAEGVPFIDTGGQDVNFPVAVEFAFVGLLLKMTSLFMGDDAELLCDFSANAAFGLFSTIDFSNGCLQYHNLYEGLNQFEWLGFMGEYKFGAQCLSLAQTLSSLICMLTTWPAMRFWQLTTWLFSSQDSLLSFYATTFWIRRGCSWPVCLWIIPCPLGFAATVLHCFLVGATLLAVVIGFLAFGFVPTMMILMALSVPIAMLSQVFVLELFGLLPIACTVASQLMGNWTKKLSAIAMSLSTIDHLLHSSLMSTLMRVYVQRGSDTSAYFSSLLRRCQGRFTHMYSRISRQSSEEFL